MQTTTSILLEIPESISESIRGYLANHPDWDMDRVFTAAIALFLLQNGNLPNKQAIERTYLDAQFGPSRNN